MITLEDLSVAHEQSVWPTEALERVVRPFDRTFQPVPTSDLLRDVVKIGSIPVEQESKGRQRGRAAHESATAWLVAG